MSPPHVFKLLKSWRSLSNPLPHAPPSPTPPGAFCFCRLIKQLFYRGLHTNFRGPTEPCCFPLLKQLELRATSLFKHWAFSLLLHKPGSVSDLANQPISVQHTSFSFCFHWGQSRHLFPHKPNTRLSLFSLLGISSTSSKPFFTCMQVVSKPSTPYPRALLFSSHIPNSLLVTSM